MKIFIEFIDKGIYGAITNGLFIAMHIVGNEIVEKSWYDDENKDLIWFYGKKKKYYNTCLNIDEFFRVVSVV